MTVEMSPDVIRAMSPDERAKYDEEVAGRVIRLDSLRANWDAFDEARLPEFKRAVYQYVGSFALERFEKARPKGENFSFGLCYAEPGRGAPLHAHTTEEVFFALTGRWAVYWGEPEQPQEIYLDTWDAVSLPAPVMRGFRNVTREGAYLLVVLGGGAPPPPIYHPSVDEQVRESQHQHTP